MATIDKLVEAYFKKEEKSQISPMDYIMEAIDEVYNEFISQPTIIKEQSAERFSYSIAIPKLVPTEAWGDPNNQSREEINRVFSVVRGGSDIRARIADINKF